MSKDEAMALVRGKLTMDWWDKDGQEQKKNKISAESISLKEASSKPSAGSGYGTNQSHPSQDQFEDDIPF
jgi:single-stranded DNA-binding protein